ncbi:MAG: hypothetical protein JO283_15775 [Bradyrhizobium sp.]|nr:hypothetical protein [Bradyrhizobium sp.]
MVFTPGPNNILVFSSGPICGLRAPSFLRLFGLPGIGFNNFITYPLLQTVLKYAGAAHLIHLAVAIALSVRRKPARMLLAGP